MSVSREWNSLKAAWVILLLILVARIFLSNQFLLTPDEAVYWQTSYYSTSSNDGYSPILTGAIRLSTSLLGNNEIAVRLPAILALTIAGIYMMLLTASMFSWHTALHVTLLSQGILQLNMAALVISPYSLLLPCWTAFCYHCSQAMNDNETGQWLLAGFWFGFGLLCKFSMILILPCIMLCFILIKPFRKCLLFPGPWLGFLLALIVFLPSRLWLGNIDLATFIDKMNIMNLIRDLIPDATHSLQFIIDNAVLLTPVVLLLILGGWLTGSNKRHLVQSDVHFLILTSFPLFLLYLIFPVFAGSGSAWSANAFVTAIILIAGLHSSTRSSFKGHPNLRWAICVITAYCITIPLVLKIAYPMMPLQINLSQTRVAASGWDLLGKEVNQSLHLMPDQKQTFIFSMEPKLAAELSFYVPGNPRIVSLDHRTRTANKDYIENERHLVGQDSIGLITTQAAFEQAELLFEKVEIEREVTLSHATSTLPGQNRSFKVIRGFGFK